MTGFFKCKLLNICFNLILFATGIYVNPLLQVLAAHVKINKGTLVGHAHGGIYGKLTNFSQEFIERKITDYYITPGWKIEAHKNFAPSSERYM